MLVPATMFSVCKGKIVLADRTENILPINVFVELTARPQHQRNSSTCSSLGSVLMCNEINESKIFPIKRKRAFPHATVTNLHLI